MKKILLLVFVQLTCYSFNVFSQKKNSFDEYLPGYIITNKNDTIKGKISNKGFVENALRCEFIDLSETKHTYTPNEIQAYQFANGKFYISKEVNNKRVFLEYLVKGKLDFYYFQNESNQDIFYASKDSSQLIELKYINKTIELNGLTRKREQKLFVNQLNILTQDFPELSTSINRINEPNQKDLIKVAKKYHEKTCNTGEQCLIFEKKQKREILFSLSVSGNHLLRSSEGLDLRKNYVMFNSSIHFQQFRKSEKLFVGFGLNFSGNSSLEGKKNDKGKLIQANVQIPLSLSYIVLKDGFSPVFSYSFDLNYFLLLHNIQAGLRYQKDNFSVFTTAGISTGSVIYVYGSQLNVGVFYKLNRR